MTGNGEPLCAAVPVHQVLDRDDFPQPVLRPSSGPLRLQAAVEAYAETVRRKPGRPRVVTAAVD